MKTKSNSDNNLSLNKLSKPPMLTIIVRSVFKKDGKYYPQISLDECLYELQMIQHERIDVSEGIDIT